MEIKAFKLVSGDDVVSKFKKIKEGYLLIDPRKILLMPSSQGLGYMYVVLSLCDIEKNEFTIKDEHILFESDVEDNMKQKYLDEISVDNNDSDLTIPSSDNVV